ncbi:MAG TPA: hypothetical protein VKP58_14640 [Candidatus Acidoferrum sp.]|nr:hypothetical protein [Candidatus Acidoferrum sp.]
MSPRKLVVSIVASSIALVCALALFAADAQPQSGSWTIEPADESGKVRFALMQHSKDHSNHHESDWSPSSFEGLDLSIKSKHDVKFTIRRDAGRFECEGYIENAEGAGVFHFFPDGKYAANMTALGFSVEPDKLFGMAVQDVSLGFAKEMKNENLSGLDTDKLIAFRIFNVNSQFIKELRAEGLAATDSDKLIAFRIHGVSPEFVRSVRSAGYHPDQDELIAMRIHGATPEWMAQLKKEGYDHVELEKLIAFRIHGVSPEFIGKIESLGYKHPEPDQLIAMRIHGVTPEFISNLKSRGMKDLTIDQLVSLRIHGID